MTSPSLDRRTALAGAAVTLSSAASAQDKLPTVLITGASRGIGFGLATKYAERGWTVIATARNPSRSEDLQALAAKHTNVRPETLDVTDLGQIDTLAAKLRGTPIDVLINNAGISGGAENQVFGQLNYDAFDSVMHTNVLGPLKIAEAFTEHIAASGQKKLINISSTEGSLGSISRRPDYRNYFYRASKAALNMEMVNVAKAVKDKGITVLLLSPGFVRSDFTAGIDLPIMISVDESATQCMDVIDKATIEQSGMFFNQRGEPGIW
ncbi:MAG: SDR family oxidoreductase [Rhodobacteraceae bacterium]|nr:SDR family oxidoreductase [Paracoccaceae bacterium]